MTKLTAAERSLLGRIGAYTANSRHSGLELTEAARRAFRSKFLDDVDPNHELPVEERERRAELARKAHYARLAYLSARSRRRRREHSQTGQVERGVQEAVVAGSTVSPNGGLHMDDRVGLIRRFDAAMNEIYYAAARLGYRPTRFLEMVQEYGGLETAHRLLAADKIHDGLAELFLLGRLDLTVEHHVLLPEYGTLFSETERTVAKARLGRES